MRLWTWLKINNKANRPVEVGVVVFSAATMAGEETEGGVEDGAELVEEGGGEVERSGHYHYWPCACPIQHHHSDLQAHQPSFWDIIETAAAMQQLLSSGLLPRDV